MTSATHGVMAQFPRHTVAVFRQRGSTNLAFAAELVQCRIGCKDADGEGAEIAGAGQSIARELMDVVAFKPLVSGPGEDLAALG